MDVTLSPYRESHQGTDTEQAALVMEMRLLEVISSGERRETNQDHRQDHLKSP